MSIANTPIVKKELIEEMIYLSQVNAVETSVFQQKIAEKFSLNTTDMRLLLLFTSVSSLTAGEISVKLGLTTGAVTNVIDRLEVKDIVKRQRDESDRRKVIVVANKKKLTEMTKEYNDIRALFIENLQNYNENELRLLMRFYNESISITREVLVS
jgi:DNA-binding MarR family transcriptional regulator